jgi:hypothetical protein
VYTEKEIDMKRLLCTAALVALPFTTAFPASAAPAHDEASTASAASSAVAPSAEPAGAGHAQFSIAGDVVSCPVATFTVLSGSIKEVFQEVTTPSGNSMFTVTDVPLHVVITDEHGTRYGLHGATWFGGVTIDSTGAEVLTATHNLEIVTSGGGVAASVRLIERFRDGELISHEFGTCLP